ncbi:MAG: hypothetical protein HKO59_00015, partial [Phycisphaerales bacterium]|nr:hypothetical protein [Phycisphaerales bacterium]
MFVVRQVNPDDHPTIIKFARMQHFASLPADAEEIARQIAQSRDSFAGRVAEPCARRFIFVLEDTDTGSIIGLSALDAFLCRPDEPLTYLRMARNELYSDELQAGHVHVTLTLDPDVVPTTGLSCLVMAPAYRGHPQRLGAMLGRLGLHFIALHRSEFADRIVAELPPPPTRDPQESFWESLGRRFVNLSQAEAERFHARSREFMASLLPPGEIYVALLAPETRKRIGKVAEMAVPARTILTREGFAFQGRIEPFGGGPVLEAAVSEIALIERTRPATLGDPAREHPVEGYVSLDRGGTFRAVQCRYADHGECISIPGEAAGLLDAQVGDTVG